LFEEEREKEKEKAVSAAELATEEEAKKVFTGQSNQVGSKFQGQIPAQPVSVSRGICALLRASPTVEILARPSERIRIIQTPTSDSNRQFCPFQHFRLIEFLLTAVGFPALTCATTFGTALALQRAAMLRITSEAFSWKITGRGFTFKTDGCGRYRWLQLFALKGTL
jgi:hypothetical protein